MSKSKTELATTAIQWVVGVSTSFTVRRALINNVDPKNKREKLELTVGSVAVGSLVGEACEMHVKNLLEQIVSAFNKTDENTTN